MYIELVISATQFTFQRKDEAGTNIGAANVFSVDDYALFSNDPSIWIINPAGITTSTPPVAAYPKDRTILTTT